LTQGQKTVLAARLHQARLATISRVGAFWRLQAPQAPLRAYSPSGRPSTAEAAACGEGCLSVKDYGAVGDGSTDDSGAFQAALNDAAKAGAELSQFPAGFLRLLLVIQG
jgi:Pectate lyase superfamily protein